MHRLALVLVASAALVIWVAGDAFAQTDDFQLPPVKLKPDRPTKTKPIPPAPDDRDPPAAAPKEDETPKAPPDEKPLDVPKKETPPAAKPDETPGQTPPAPKPAEPPEKLPGDIEPPAAKPPAVDKDDEAKRQKAREEALKFFSLPNDSEVTPADLPMPKPVIEPPTKPPAVLAVPGESPKPPRATALQAKTIEAQVGPAVGADLTGFGEVGLVEEVARTRKAYERAIKALTDYYMQRGTVHKIDWATSEMTALGSVPKIQYLVIAELAGPDLRPSRSIEVADQLYAEGVQYKDYPAFPPAKKEYLKTALEKFHTIIEKYPTSDKIDDAAFRMGEIYGGWYFEDWARAVGSYQRCWEWNPKTEHPALFNAAKIYDERLKNRVKAVELYNRVIAETTDEGRVNEAQNRLKALTAR